MNSFTVTAIGNLAETRNFPRRAIPPTRGFVWWAMTMQGKMSTAMRARRSRASGSRRSTALGEAIAKNSRKGDQLIVRAHMRSNNWTDKDGEKKYEHSFIVDSFRFGAPGKIKREELAARREETDALETEI